MASSSTGPPFSTAVPELRIVRAVAAIVLAAALTTTASTASAAERSLFIEDYTWPELRDAIAGGRSTVLLPIGGTEQNGPHMALGKHNARVRLLAEKIADALGDALVAPVVAYVPEGDPERPTGHLRFPGTISAPVGAFEQTLEYAVASLRRHGFRAIVLLGDHGGYQSSLVRVAERANRAPASRARVFACTEYYRASQEAFAARLLEHGYRRDEIGLHAGLADTSLMMALDPAMVRAEVAAARSPGADDGVSGDPRRASAELGREGVGLVVARTVEAVRARLRSGR